MREFLSQPWPWYVAGPLIGLIVPALLFVGNKQFGISANLRHACAIMLPGNAEFFRYDWRRIGGWNIAFAIGILIGGYIASSWLASGASIAISAATQRDLATLRLHDYTGLVPAELFNWQSLTTLRGFVMIIVGGVLVGFGTAYAGGCTSGHAISGLANLQMPSLIASLGFFAGGVVATWFIIPALLQSGL